MDAIIREGIDVLAGLCDEIADLGNAADWGPVPTDWTDALDRADDALFHARECRPSLGEEDVLETRIIDAARYAVIAVAMRRAAKHENHAKARRREGKARRG